jgi:hypothetical protein
MSGGLVDVGGAEIEAPAPKIEMQTWEYLVIPNMVAHTLDPKQVQPGWSPGQLNEMGEEGWEVATSTMQFLILKRPCGPKVIEVGS